MNTLKDVILEHIEALGMSDSQHDRYLELKYAIKNEEVSSEHAKCKYAEGWFEERRKIGNVLKSVHVTTMGDLKNLGMKPI